MAFVFGRIMAALGPSSPGPSAPGPSTEVDQNSYDPSVKDVLNLKYRLRSISSLPLELIDTIIDLAEYWPCTTTIMSSHQRIHDDKFILRSLPLGFVPGPKSELLGFGDPYNLAYPFPWPDSSKPPKDVPEQVLNQLRSKFHSRGEHPCRKIVFTLKSHDQGWADDISNKGTYVSSWTWFDVGLEKMITFDEKSASAAPVPRFRLTHHDPETLEEPGEADVAFAPTTYSLRTILPTTTTKENSVTHEISWHWVHPLLPSNTLLQKNVNCDRNTKEHVITWSWNDNIDPESEEANDLVLQGRGQATGSGDMVRSLVLGDVVTVWAKARFPGWSNIIEQVKIDLYWAV